MLRDRRNLILGTAARLSVCSMIALALLVLTPVRAWCLPILSVQPSTSTVALDGLFTVDIVVGADAGTDDDVADLFAYQFGVAFDPTVVRAVSVTPGSFLGGEADAFYIPGLIDNENGTIGFNAGAVIGLSPGVSGSGSLLTVQFLAVAAGVSTIAPVLDPALNDFFLDSLFGVIEPTLRQGSVIVAAAPTSVPEPATLALLMMGLGAMAFRSSRASAPRA
jgi:hypothetical protein